jgi:hypothetical protein
MVDCLMEQVVEELAPRLPYPLMGDLMIAVDRGARKDKKVEVKSQSTQVGFWISTVVQLCKALAAL